MLEELRRFMIATPTVDEMQVVRKELVPFFEVGDPGSMRLTDGRLLSDLGGTPPRLVTRVTPRYPDAARRSFLKGHSFVLGSLSEDGIPEILCVHSQNPIFTRYSIEAVRQWRYDPARVDGKPVSVLLHVDVWFGPEP